MRCLRMTLMDVRDEESVEHTGSSSGQTSTADERITSEADSRFSIYETDKELDDDLQMEDDDPFFNSSRNQHSLYRLSDVMIRNYPRQ